MTYDEAFLLADEGYEIPDYDVLWYLQEMGG